MAFVFGLGLMLTVVSMSSFKGEKNLTIEQWHFKNGRTLSQATDPASYELLSSIPTPTCSGVEVIPCIISFDNANSSTPDLETYLANFDGNNEAVTMDADTKREN